MKLLMLKYTDSFTENCMYYLGKKSSHKIDSWRKYEKYENYLPPAGASPGVVCSSNQQRIENFPRLKFHIFKENSIYWN